MSVAAELHSPEKPASETRKILGPGGNRVRVLEEEKGKKERLKKKHSNNNTNNNTAAVDAKKLVSESPKAAVLKNRVGDRYSETSFCNGSVMKSVSSKRKVKNSSGVIAAKVVPHGRETLAVTRVAPGLVKRCDWITPNSETIYASFHDEEWGVPVKDETKLFELLVLSQALAELPWPTILRKRETFRRIFNNFDLLSVASIDEKKLLALSTNGNSLLSEQKLRAIVENAKLVLKIQQEFGSFSDYCWRFVSHKPIRNGFRYARQVPAKTPKSELMSRGLMQRGFRCVGPTVVYSFMQVAGMVNGHLVSCFRYNECNSNFNEDLDAEAKKETDV
ncbi:uncharacterized protein [Coffea arabica]|uniref:GMP synthase [glutamine-hydrolyzing] n=1 Tax=Coffea arabica TaxID=13443 RepID=A0A6P6UL26_COFAR|nr:uncharacterized protein LOC113712094 isoform X1 [Coffea arabica]